MYNENDSGPVFKVENKSAKVYEKISCTWKVKNFESAFQNDVDFQLKSAEFSGTDDNLYRWYVSLYPNGKNESCKDFVSLFLRLVSCQQDVSAVFKLGMESIDGKPICLKECKTDFVPGGLAYGWYEFIKREDLIPHIQNGDIRIHAEIEIKKDTCDIKTQIPNKLTSILDNLTYSDVTLSVDGKKIHAHRIILAARSKKFANLFKKNKKLIEIHDLSYDVAILMQRFIYNNNIDIPDIDMAEKLLESADNYGLTDLKSVCFDYLVKNLDKSTVLHIYALAEKFEANGLKDYSLQYIIDHHAEVYDEKKIQELAKHSPKLCDSLKKLKRNMKGKKILK